LKPVYRTARNCGRIESFGDILSTLDAGRFAQYRPTAQFFIGPSPRDVTYEMSMDATVGEVVSLYFKHMMYKLPREVFLHMQRRMYSPVLSCTRTLISGGIEAGAIGYKCARGIAEESVYV
jgi:hypothetical protein